MKYITKFVALLGIGFLAQGAYAHVSWDSINGEDCPTPYNCRDTPIDLLPGATITVVYDVVIQHGGPIQIDLYGLDSNGASTTLKSNLPEEYGLNSTTITLPTQTCDQCVLTVKGSGYSGDADIRVTASVPQPDTTAPDDISNFLSSAEDSQMHLMWSNPTDDFSQVVIVQSTEWTDGQAVDGESYAVGAMLGNGEVIYVGSADQWKATQLSRNTEYFFKVFTTDAALNYSAGTVFSATTTDIGNNPPWASIEVSQGSSHVHSTIAAEDGPVSLNVTVMDADANDSHSYDWSGTDNRLVNTANQADDFTFDPAELSAGNYAVYLTVSDSGNPVMTSTVEITLSITADTPATPDNPPRKKGGVFNGFTMWFVILMLGCLRRTKAGGRLPANSRE